MDERDELRRDATFHDHDHVDDDMDSTVGDGAQHATTGGAAAAGAVTGGVIGLAGGPIGAAVGAVGGAIVGAATERMMHHDDDTERADMGLDNDHDSNPLIEDRDRAMTRDTETGYASGTGATHAERSGMTGPDTTYGDRSRMTDVDTMDEGGRMQLREEELQARKTSTESGAVTLGKDVVSEQRTMEVPVTREEVVIDRQPVDRRVSDTPIGDAEREAIEVPVREEQVSVEKRPVVYEEVSVGKRSVEETRDVDSTVRREELRVHEEGDAHLHDSEPTNR